MPGCPGFDIIRDADQAGFFELPGDPEFLLDFTGGWKQFCVNRIGITKNLVFTWPGF
jgi:hypothetical protein